MSIGTRKPALGTKDGSVFTTPDAHGVPPHATIMIMTVGDKSMFRYVAPLGSDMPELETRRVNPQKPGDFERIRHK